jgi:hypothetical protein
MGVSIPETLRVRHQQSAIVAGLAMAIMRSMQRAYTAKNFGQLMEHFAIACSVRLNDQDGGEPCTVAALSRLLGMPRSNVDRAAKSLVKQGLLRKEGNGFVGDLDFLAEHFDADYFKETCAAILAAADELRGTGVAVLCLLEVVCI